MRDLFSIHTAFTWSLTYTYTICWIYVLFVYLQMIISDITTKLVISDLGPSSGIGSISGEHWENLTQEFHIEKVSYEIGLLQTDNKTLSIYIDLFGKAILLVLYNNYATGIISLIKYKVVSEDSFILRKSVVYSEKLPISMLVPSSGIATISSMDTALCNSNNAPDIGDILSLSPDLISTNPHMWVYMIDIVYINLQYILQLFTHLNIISILVEYKGFNIIICKNLLLFLFSLFTHLLSLYLYINYVIDLKLHLDIKYFFYKKITRVIVWGLIGVPIFVDRYIIAYTTNDILLYNSNIITLYIFGFIAILKPAYKWNTIVLHILLIIQSVILTNSNYFSVFHERANIITE